MLQSSPPLEYPKDVLSIGYLTGAFGIRGELRFRPHNPNTDILEDGLQVHVRLYQKRSANPYTIASIRDTGKGPVLTLKGVHSRTEAEGFRHAEIFVHETLLPELDDDEFYYFKLEGYEVVSTEGEALGKVVQILDNPAHPLLLLKQNKQEVMIPMVDAFVKDLDEENARIVIEVWPGLLGDDS
jgi:16S rRNA processing protein RimM